MFSKLSRPARGTSRSDQKMVSRAITRVIDQARNMRVLLERYVFSQLTSDGAGARLAKSFIGSGSIRACTAICYRPSIRLSSHGVGKAYSRGSLIQGHKGQGRRFEYFVAG